MSAYDPKRTFVGLQGLICFTCSKGTPPSVTPISSHWRAGAIRTWAVFSPCDPQTAARAYCICLATGQRLYSHCLSMPVSTYGQHLQGQPEFSARSRPILRKFCIPCHLNHRQDVPERPGLAAGASLRRLLIWRVALGTDDLFLPEIVKSDAATGTGPLFPPFRFAHQSSSLDCDLRRLTEPDDSRTGRVG